MTTNDSTPDTWVDSPPDKRRGPTVWPERLREVRKGPAGKWAAWDYETSQKANSAGRGVVTARRALLAALVSTVVVLSVLMLTAKASAADYSDPGPLATSTVPVVSTHPQTYVPSTSGGLADTGSQATTLARIGVLFLFAGGVLFLASSKREHRHG